MFHSGRSSTIIDGLSLSHAAAVVYNSTRPMYAIYQEPVKLEHHVDIYPLIPICLLHYTVHCGAMGRCLEVKSLGVRKGAWTHEEDRLLKRCVEMHGEGKWRQVPMKAGLNRCPKSCRLRWFNYLCPNIKRGEFSEDEIDLIIRLHKLLGNRWSLIAGRPPGRTANDIKNFWNSYMRKKFGINKEENKLVKSDHRVLIRLQPRTLSVRNTKPSSLQSSRGEREQQQEKKQLKMMQQQQQQKLPRKQKQKQQFVLPSSPPENSSWWKDVIDEGGENNKSCSNGETGDVLGSFMINTVDLMGEGEDSWDDFLVDADQLWEDLEASLLS